MLSQVICHPQLLQRANASVTHSAVEAACPALSAQGIRDLLQQKRFVVVHDCPDNASANARRQHQVRALQHLPA